MVRFLASRKIVVGDINWPGRFDCSRELHTGSLDSGLVHAEVPYRFSVAEITLGAGLRQLVFTRDGN